MVKNKKYSGAFLFCMLLPVFLSGMIRQATRAKPPKTIPVQFPGGSKPTYTPITGPSTEPTTFPAGTKATGTLGQETFPQKNLPTFFPQPPKEVKIAELSQEDIQEIRRANLEEELKESLSRYENIVIPQAKQLHIDVSKFEQQIPKIKTAENISQNNMDAISRVFLALERAIEAKQFALQLYDMYTFIVKERPEMQDITIKDLSFVEEKDVQTLSDNYDKLKRKAIEGQKVIKKYADELITTAKTLGIKPDIMNKFEKVIEVMEQKNVTLTQQQIKDLADELEDFEMTIEEKELDIEEEKEKQKQELKLAEEAAQLKAIEEQKIKTKEALENKIADQEKELKKDVAQQQNIKEELDTNEKESKNLDVKKEETILDKPEQEKVNQEIKENKEETENLERRLEEKTVEIEQQKEMTEKEKQELEQKNKEIKELDAERKQLLETMGQKKPLEEIAESIAKVTPKDVVSELPVKPEEAEVEKPTVPKETEVTKEAGKKESLQEVPEEVQKTVSEVKEVKIKEERPEGGDGEVPPKIEKEEIREQKEEEEKEAKEVPQLPIIPQEEIIVPQEKEANIAEVKAEITPEVKPTIISQPQKEIRSVPETKYQQSLPEVSQSTISPAIISTGASQAIRPTKVQTPMRASESQTPPFKPSISSGTRADVSPESVSAPSSMGITLPYTQRIDLGPRVPEKVVTPPQEIKIDKKAQPQAQVWWEKLLPTWVAQRLGRKDRTAIEKPTVAKPETTGTEEEKVEKVERKEASVIETIIEVVKKPVINVINYIRGLFGVS